jgi:hypothetical protein
LKLRAFDVVEQHVEQGDLSAASAFSQVAGLADKWRI